MLSALLSIDFNPGIRGIIVTLVMFVFLVGGTYLLVGTNLGARLGFLIVATTLAGWMMLMCIVWAIYGIGLKGPEPKWKPNEPIAIVRDGALMDRAEVLETSINLDGLDPTAAALLAVRQLQLPTKFCRLKLKNSLRVNMSPLRSLIRVASVTQRLVSRSTSLLSGISRVTQLFRLRRSLLSAQSLVVHQLACRLTPQSLTAMS